MLMQMLRGADAPRWFAEVSSKDLIASKDHAI
jgi:hypothetical protein